MCIIIPGPGFFNKFFLRSGPRDILEKRLYISTEHLNEHYGLQIYPYHNTYGSVLISILVSAEIQQLTIKVENPFNPRLKSAGGTGFGLSPIKRRLYLLFADQGLLKMDSLRGNLYRTTLQIPQNYDQSHTH